MRRLSRLLAQLRLCLPRTRHSPGRERLVADLLRHIRFPIRRWPNRSGITAETMVGRSGLPSGPTTTVRPMANRSWMARNQRQAISIRRIPMMSPGIGRIDIRRPSHLLIDPMCRAAPPRPSRFLGVTAPRKRSMSHGATRVFRSDCIGMEA
jgi:hypothetical protein